MKSFLENRTKIPSHKDTPAPGQAGFQGLGQHARAAAAAANASGRQESAPESIPNPNEEPSKPAPKVEVIRDGDKISRIVITLVDGDKLELDCQY